MSPLRTFLIISVSGYELMLLTSAVYVHLKHLDISRHTRNLSPASRAILLTGTTEIYHQMLQSTPKEVQALPRHHQLYLPCHPSIDQ